MRSVKINKYTNEGKEILEQKGLLEEIKNIANTTNQLKDTESRKAAR